MSDVLPGRCLCGNIQFEGRGAPHVAACHCTICRRWHGGPSVSVRFDLGIGIVAGEENVGWYRSSDWAERGFCKTCGSTLFYRLIENREIMGEAGSFVLPAGLQVTEHYFVDEQPDYYEFKDDAPRLTGAEVFERYAHDV